MAATDQLAHLLATSRMNLSIFRRRKLIVVGSFQHGTQRSLLHLDCERFRASFISHNRVLTRSLLRPSYLLSLVLKRLFLFNCNVPMLRLTTLLSLLSLPIALTRLLCYHKHERPAQPILSPSPEAIVLSAFPIAWFFGFLYYTEVPSVLFVVWTVVAASQGNHWIAALVCTMILCTMILFERRAHDYQLGLMSCSFRQTNIVWVLYAYASSQLTYLHFRRASPGQPHLQMLHDPPCLAASLSMGS